PKQTPRLPSHQFFPNEAANDGPKNLTPSPFPKREGVNWGTTSLTFAKVEEATRTLTPFPKREGGWGVRSFLGILSPPTLAEATHRESCLRAIRSGVRVQPDTGVLPRSHPQEHHPRHRDGRQPDPAAPARQDAQDARDREDAPRRGRLQAQVR